MHLAVKRPRAIDYLHPNGQEAKIDFMWGDEKSLCPTGITIWLRVGPRYINLGNEFGRWSTYGEATRYGISLAYEWLSRQEVCQRTQHNA